MKALAVSVSAAVLIAVAASTPADAARLKKRSIFFPPAAMNPVPIYRDDILDPTILTDTQTSKFRVSFVLPPDYAPDTTATLRLTLWSASACSAVLGAEYVDRKRIGQNFYETANPNHDGITGANITVVNVPASKYVIKSISIKKPQNAPYTGQKPGDGIAFLFQREPGNSLDNCGLLNVEAAELRYKARY